jgi:hypothetical protein
VGLHVLEDRAVWVAGDDSGAVRDLVRCFQYFGPGRF